MRGIRLLVEHGFLPIITVTRTRDDQDEAALVEGFVQMLKDHGYARPPPQDPADLANRR